MTYEVIFPIKSIAKNMNIRSNLEEEMIMMKSQINNKNEQFESLESMVKKGYESNENAIKEIKAKEIENIKLKLSLECEQKNKELEAKHQ